MLLEVFKWYLKIGYNTKISISANNLYNYDDVYVRFYIIIITGTSHT